MCMTLVPDSPTGLNSKQRKSLNIQCINCDRSNPIPATLVDLLGPQQSSKLWKLYHMKVCMRSKHQGAWRTISCVSSKTEEDAYHGKLIAWYITSQSSLNIESKTGWPGEGRRGCNNVNWMVINSSSTWRSHVCYDAAIYSVFIYFLSQLHQLL